MPAIDAIDDTLVMTPRWRPHRRDGGLAQPPRRLQIDLDDPIEHVLVEPMGWPVAGTDAHIVLQHVEPPVLLDRSGDDPLRSPGVGHIDDERHGFGSQLGDRSPRRLDGIGVPIDQDEACPLLGEPHRGGPSVPDRRTALLSGADDGADGALEAAHERRSP